MRLSPPGVTSRTVRKELVISLKGFVLRFNDLGKKYRREIGAWLAKLYRGLYSTKKKGGKGKGKAAEDGPAPEKKLRRLVPSRADFLENNTADVDAADYQAALQDPTLNIQLQPWWRHLYLVDPQADSVGRGRGLYSQKPANSLRPRVDCMCESTYEYFVSKAEETVIGFSFSYEVLLAREQGDMFCVSEKVSPIV